MPRRNHSHTKAQGHKTKTYTNNKTKHPENVVRKPVVITSNEDSFIAQSLRLTDKRR